ncbi:MAG: heavy-metal-associated domain-containing protein [Cytophagales bacterium]|nr:heavy-metal-associated domain-containing protein [Cytophagales bacterium]
MKRLLFIVCLFVFTKAYTQNTDTLLPDTISIKPDGNKIQHKDTIAIMYRVYGMNCPGCHGALEKQINKIPGVIYSKADWVKQEIEIFSDTIISEEDVFKRIKKANFTPGEKVE